VAINRQAIILMRKPRGGLDLSAAASEIFQ
jgi:hypothetical protein